MTNNEVWNKIKFILPVFVTIKELNIYLLLNSQEKSMCKGSNY